MNTLRRQSCPACESERVSWQLHRVGGRRQGSSTRELHWTCRACGHEWSAPTSDGTDTPDLPETVPMP